MTNINVETGVPFGYISTDKLAEGVLDELTYQNGKNLTCEAAEKEFMAQARREFDDADGKGMYADVNGDFDEDNVLQDFSDKYQGDEEVYAGEQDGVKYQTSWLGGAQNLFVFFSPIIVTCRQCSPCVPHAADIQGFGSYEGYGLPADWLADHFIKELCESACFSVMPDGNGTFFYQKDDSIEREGGFETEEAAWADCYNKNIVITKENKDA